MRARVALVAGVLVATTLGCGNDSAARAPGGDEPTTARALAAVVEDHLADRLGKATSARREHDVSDELRGQGTTLRYRKKDEPSGLALSVAVGTTQPPGLGDCADAENDFYSGCEETSDGVLFWEQEAPEEDPGVVYVTVTKGPTRVVVYSSGARITGDPRDLDLRISVDDMFAIADDARIDVTTSADAIESGAELSSWTDEG